MKFVNFGSSSSGNCYYIELQRADGMPPAKILLEAGISYKEVVQKASAQGVDLSEIDAILVTHEQSRISRNADSRSTQTRGSRKAIQPLRCGQGRQK